ncbi:MAG: hypothetical protein HN542_03430 [Flavobacteriales bacterium]|jgi:hypothetical protein|nr:hypothetical protein [Flavobacteriales bacterium]MBT3962660.1 hypothetical protein [Flavobacteriales bacterium]MBT4705062.1 hypothetical protein [Flavobacteriales bacterium]MBT4930082.1 hypothetical protein [Flavobacteriales bacterium]MBT5133040.1 hypothetical protein [Flavobacteriales bacterium]
MKFRAAFFTLLYLVSVVGYGLEFHYCLGEITDWNYVLLETSCHCDDSHQGLVKGCCEEKAFFIQIEEAHQSPATTDIAEVELPLQNEICWDCVEHDVEAQESSRLQLDRGPPKTLDRTIAYHSLIFYG